jgi:hypothetical protein
VLHNATVTDDKIADAEITCVAGNGATDNTAGDNIIDVLEVDGTFTCTATGTAILGDYENNSKVVAEVPALPGTTVEDEDPSHYKGVSTPRVDIEKDTNGTQADLPGEAVEAGIGSELT